MITCSLLFKVVGIIFSLTLFVQGKGMMTTYWLTSRKNTVFIVKNECELLLDEKLAPNIFPRGAAKSRLSASGIFNYCFFNIFLILSLKIAINSCLSSVIQLFLLSVAISRGSSISLAGKEPSLLRRIIEHATARHDSSLWLHNDCSHVRYENSADNEPKLAAIETCPDKLYR